MLRFLFCLSFLALAACDRVAEVSVSPEDEQAARHYVDLLRQGNFAAIQKETDPALANTDLGGTLAKMAEQFPAEEPTSVRILRARLTENSEVVRNDLTFEYVFPSAPVLVTVALQKRGELRTLAAFSALRIPANLNDFTLKGRTALQYSVLALALLIPLFTLYALIACLRGPMPGRTPTQRLWIRWGWVIVIVFSVGRFTIDWMTGIWVLQPLSLLLFGTGAARSLGGHGPWTLSIGLPIGAFAFLVWHRFYTGRSGDAEISRPA